MQRLARRMKLSETAFLLPPTTPEAGCRVRIFTLARELSFAWHLTLGSCHAWLTGSGKSRRPDSIIQECAAGHVRVRRSNNGLVFAAPPLRSWPVDDAFVGEPASVSGIDRDRIVDTRWADNGPGRVVVLLRDAAAVPAVEQAGA